jgi:hypothetical protein
MDPCEEPLYLQRHSESEVQRFRFSQHKILFEAFNDAVNDAKLLRKLILSSILKPFRGPSGLEHLPMLFEHSALKDFRCSTPAAGGGSSVLYSPEALQHGSDWRRRDPSVLYSQRHCLNTCPDPPMLRWPYYPPSELMHKLSKSNFLAVRHTSYVGEVRCTV